MRRSLFVLVVLSLMLSACSTDAQGLYNGELPSAQEDAQQLRQRLAQQAFDRVAMAVDQEQWQQAVALRKDFQDISDYVDTLWATRSSEVSLAWKFGMALAPRRDAASLARFPGAAATDDLARAELWLKRGLQAASRHNHELLPELRYDYARVLLESGNAPLALEVIANRFEVEPIDPSLEALYQSLLDAIAAKMG